VGIAQTAPHDPADTRAQVADVARIKDPADIAYQCAPARFIRAIRAVAPQANMIGMREAIGETDFEPQQILGYAPIEPDGSFKLLVPADVPLALAVVDAKGRGLQTHLNWIQIRPGERRTCDGCHSPRRGAALNSGTVVNTMPAGVKAAMSAQHLSGETMASLRTRLDAAALHLGSDMVFADVWADTTQAGVTARPSIALRYTGNANPADDLVTPAPVNGIINYPDHIAPLWTRDRGANTCINCHGDPTALDLSAGIGGSGRVNSYDRLLIGDPLIDPVTGQPVTRLEDGVPVIVREPALVEPGAGNAAPIARSSRLTEILFGEELLAGSDARTVYPNPPASAPDHAAMLNMAEKRLLVEWMDLGAQYLNDPSSSSNVRTVAALSSATFESQVLPVLRDRCLACHQPGGNSGAAQTGSSSLRNRFVLTGNAEGDFNVTLTMVSDTCNPSANYLLSRPSTAPHPAGAIGQTTPPLPAGSAEYNAIAGWISAGCGGS
jgi:mono/diheme cytochrome c family protein